MSIINEALKRAQENKGQALNKDMIKQSEESRTPPPGALAGSFARPRKNIKFIFLITFIIVAVSIGLFIKWRLSAVSDKAVLSTPLIRRSPARLSGGASKTASVPTLTLNGIVYDEQRPYAIVNNKVLLEGDTIEGATLVEINQGRVKFIFNDKEFELNAE